MSSKVNQDGDNGIAATVGTEGNTNLSVGGVQSDKSCAKKRVHFNMEDNDDELLKYLYQRVLGIEEDTEFLEW
jgi:hypothetical protein